MVVVDHHDSYTWNLVHLVAGVTGVLPTVVQHDEVEPDDVLRHSHVVLSPGPGRPDDPADFAVGREVLLAGTRPVLGVCLGMQGLVTAYGGRVERVVPGHGVVATVRHDGRGALRRAAAGLRRGALPLAGGGRAAVVPAGDRDRRAQRADHGRRARRRCRWWACSSTRSRCSRSTARRWSRTSWRRSLVSGDAAAYFREVAARHPRCFWLDGGGARARGRAGARSSGWLEDDDVSLSWSATSGEVTRHAGGRAEVVGDDVFAVLEAELAAGGPDDQWFGYLGYAARRDLPARPDPDLPDAVWMRPSHVRLFEHPVGLGPAVAAGWRRVGRNRSPGPPEGGVWYQTPTPTTRPSRSPRSTPRRTPGSRSTCTRATPTRST